MSWFSSSLNFELTKSTLVNWRMTLFLNGWEATKPCHHGSLSFITPNSHAHVSSVRNNFWAAIHKHALTQIRLWSERVFGEWSGRWPKRVLLPIEWWIHHMSRLVAQRSTRVPSWLFETFLPLMRQTASEFVGWGLAEILIILSHVVSSPERRSRFWGWEFSRPQESTRVRSTLWLVLSSSLQEALISSGEATCLRGIDWFLGTKRSALIAIVH